MNKELYEKIENTDGTIIYKPFNIYEMSIYGKTIEEIGQILDGLEIERIAEIKMTMENLSYLFKKVIDEQNKNMQLQINKMFIKGE